MIFSKASLFALLFLSVTSSIFTIIDHNNIISDFTKAVGVFIILLSQRTTFIIFMIRFMKQV